MVACYCGSGGEFEACCNPIVSGSAKADTAEALMRARYTAFVTRHIDFLHTSLHPDHRQDHDVNATRRWAEKADWLGLQIVQVEAGGVGDDQGTVEFIATYKQDGIVKPHHELSRFNRQDGDWYYVDGDLVMPKTNTRDRPKVGRNDPCPCGSGKKFKKCCGAA